MVSDELRQSVSAFADQALEQGAVGVLLGGSAAIGCEHDPPSGPPFGDIDMYIGVAPDFPARARPEWCPERLADRPLHVSIITEARAYRAAPTLRLYEAGSCGVPLAGEDIRQWLPKVTLQTLDVGDLNDIVLWRLDDLAGVWGRYLAKGCTLRLAYTACKNLLDLSTWAYPHAGVLLPSVVQRLKHPPPGDSFGVVVDVIQRFATLGPEALRAKRGGSLSLDPVELFHDVAESYLAAASAILARSSSLSLGADMSDVRARRRWAARRSLAMLRTAGPQPAADRVRLLRYPHREMLRLYVDNWPALIGDMSLLRSTRTKMAALFSGSVEESA